MDSLWGDKVRVTFYGSGGGGGSIGLLVVSLFTRLLSPILLIGKHDAKVEPPQNVVLYWKV